MMRHLERAVSCTQQTDKHEMIKHQKEGEKVEHQFL